jgi:GT2 family glycosyltransferase
MIYFLTVNYYSTNLLQKLINSLPSSPNGKYQVVVVNNSPDDESIHQLKSGYVLIIESGKNIGFGNACNLGLQWIYHQDSQAIVWIINPDAYFPDRTLAQAQIFFDSYPELSIIGNIIYTPEEEIWFAGGRFIPTTGAILNQDLLTQTDKEYIDCDWVSGCSLIINLSKFPECPLFDPIYFLYYEDFDFCRRYLQQGHLIGVTKQFSVLHQPSSITNRNVFLKIRHSTYSYLITIKKYTNAMVFMFRLGRLIAYAIILIPIKPKIAFGKLYGVWEFIISILRHY